MSIPLNPDAGWRQVATLEVMFGTPPLNTLSGNDKTDYRIEPAPESPDGYVWFDLFVDFSIGDRRAAHTAYAMLTGFQRAADDGLLPGYRLVNGADWLLIGAHLERDDPVEISSLSVH